MGTVTDYLCGLIAQQVEDKGVVVWYDPDRHYAEYAEAVAALTIPATKVASYDRSFFALRHEVESLLDGDTAPRLVVYVPLDRARTHDALAELEAAGAVVAPGQQPPSRNTRLAFVARSALAPRLGDETAASIEKQVEAGKLTLEDLNELAAKGQGLTKGVLSVVFGTTNPQDVALHFVSGDAFDAALATRNALPELASLLCTSFDAKLGTPTSPDVLRAAFVRHVLASDLATAYEGPVPSKLASVPVAVNPVARESCRALADTWRLRRDLRESYAAHAERVGKELGLASAQFDAEKAAQVGTFLEVEKALQQAVAVKLLDRAEPGLVDLARTRQSSFWSECLPDVQAQWTLIAVAGQVILEADRIECEVRCSDSPAEAVFAAYASGDNPWCALDTCHRHLERLAYSFDFELGGRHQQLEQLIHKARDRYAEAGSLLSDRFLRRFRDRKYRIPGVLRQRETFEKAVKPALAKGKTAYVWVDALRFETARELAQILGDEAEVKLQPALGTAPTITEIGMAALAPGAHESANVVPAGEGKLALVVKGTTLKDRKDRVAFLKAQAGAEVVDLKLDDLLSTVRKKVRDAVRDAKLVLVTSQEIDDLCESGNVGLARRTVDDMLDQLRRAVRVLGDLGCESVVVTADHGYLFGEEVGSEMKIDAPGGETADLHRRVWVGRGGAADQSYLRGTLAELGLGGDLEFATPWSLACFKVKGGALAYFHGGLSLQELVVPVVTVTPRKKAAVGAPGEIAWDLVLGTPKVSTRFFSVQVVGKAAGLFDLVPPKVRVEIRAGVEPVSRAVSASYGFEDGTGDVKMRVLKDDPKALEPNTLALMITGDTSQKTVDVYLLDATTGVELASKKGVEMAIAI